MGMRWLVQTVCTQFIAVLYSVALHVPFPLVQKLAFTLAQLNSMAVFSLTEVSLPSWDSIRRMLRGPVVDAENPNALFCIPVFIRRDGLVTRVGGYTQLKERDEVFVVKDILISYDLEKVFVNLISQSNCNSLLNERSVIPDEELLFDICDLVTTSRCGSSVCNSLALTSMSRIQAQSAHYPVHILRNMRKHQLCSGLRRDVQRFLSGFSIAKSWSLGPVDWRLDPGILGLEAETGFSVDFHAEKVAYAVSHLDLLLGDCWDVRQVTNSVGYRAVLTLELGIDPSGQDIQVRAHAVLCPHAICRINHRSQTLDFLRSSESGSVIGIKSCDTTRNNVETSFFPLGTAKSLTWEEFDLPCEFNLSSDECSPRLNAHQLENITVSSEPSTSTAHNTKALDEILKKANMNSQNFYFYYNSPLASNSRGRKKSDKRRLMRSMPSTSTPEDELSIDASDATSDNVEDITSENIPLVVPSDNLQGDHISAIEFDKSVGKLNLLSRCNVDNCTKNISAKNDNNNSVIKNMCDGESHTGDEKQSIISCDVESSTFPQLPEALGSVEEKVCEYIRSIETETLIQSPWIQGHFAGTAIQTSTSLQTPYSNRKNKGPLFSPEHYVSLNKRSLSDSFAASQLSSMDSTDKQVKENCKSPTAEGGRNRVLSDEANVSVCSSRSHASRASRVSELGSLTGRIGHGVGAVSSIYGIGISGQLVTPFPEDWQYNTIPEVIENDDEID